jgi:hypothetical protein
MSYLKKLALTDAIVFHSVPIPIYVNFDEDCKGLRHLEPEAEAIVLNLNPFIPPFVLEGTEDKYFDMMYTKERIEHWISLSYTESMLRWDIRSFYTTFWFTSTTLVYFHGIDGPPEDYQKRDELHWLFKYTIEASKQAREKNSSVLVLISDAIPGDDKMDELGQ